MIGQYAKAMVSTGMNPSKNLRLGLSKNDIHDSPRTALDSCVALNPLK